MDAESVKFYNYFLKLSLDGQNYLQRSVPFHIFDLRVTGLEPNIGPLVKSTNVKIKATSPVDTNIYQVRLDFPSDLQWASRVLPANFDHTTGEISFSMPELEAEVRRRVDEGSDGDLSGLEVFVELSLNGQNFTEDRVAFTYHGPLVPDVVKIVAGPDGEEHHEVKEDPGHKKTGKTKTEEPTEPAATAGSKLGCPTQGLPPVTPQSAILRVELVTGEGDAVHILKVLDLPGQIELVAVLGEHPQPMITALVPSIRSDEIPEGSGNVHLQSFQVSLNGQCFTPCPEQPPMRLELVHA